MFKYTIRQPIMLRFYKCCLFYIIELLIYIYRESYYGLCSKIQLLQYGAAK